MGSVIRSPAQAQSEKASQALRRTQVQRRKLGKWLRADPASSSRACNAAFA